MSLNDKLMIVDAILLLYISILETLMYIKSRKPKRKYNRKLKLKVIHGNKSN
jgi:hypothetical protein